MRPGKANMRVVLADQALGAVGAKASLTRRAAKGSAEKKRGTTSSDS